MNNEPVTVNKVTIESIMNYSGVPVLHYKIEYPQFIRPGSEETLFYINRWYRRLAAELQYKYETTYYNDAVSQYQYTSANDFPFNMNEALSVYEITYNQNDIISLYYDHYLYSGGAHGNTVRRSQTWNIETGCRISLFQDVEDPNQRKAEILEDIRRQIAEQEKKGENYFFEDYPQLIFEQFNPESFYYVPKGIIIYYQQYDIAPYSSGIPEFLVPFY